METAAQLTEVIRVTDILNAADRRYDEMGHEICDMVTCGTCGRTWNDARISSLTPTPSARCPFEYAHNSID